jgi:hypothetical protein
MFRRPSKPAVPTWVDDGRQVAGGDEWDAAGVVAQSSRLRAALSRGLALALWGALALALLLGLLNLSLGAAAAPEASRAPALEPEPVAPPAGCAELLVAGWIAGDLAGASRERSSEVERQAAHTYTAAATPGSTSDRWGYLIAADVRQRAGEEWEPLGVHYFAVTMVRSGAGCDGWSPAALPMQVPPPQHAEVSLPYTVTLPDSQTELSQTLEAFFDGMLAGTGDIDRYIAPGAAIPAIVPPPYTSASLTGLRAWAGTSVDTDQMPPDGTTVRLLATVTVEPARLPLAYPVTAGVRGGRWEVVAIAPLVGDPVTAAMPDTPADPTRAPNSP